ncbi:hypothetical protein TSOC_009319 [Tetrabaena socialis]|uniref:Protein kinase domain-containing protein n=1 Tax=Tetrabaena socialis TaxID=47790 RepID=A0A2J7ZW30_9CHLO|nr:hypothetical protein TSOC_009319 [Tetrabaena socialis]|eukprot:PNH04491.1 hypothetical protein TSOC_009319 [Tetrabaena socialis]
MVHGLICCTRSSSTRSLSSPDGSRPHPVASDASWEAAEKPSYMVRVKSKLQGLHASYTEGPALPGQLPETPRDTPHGKPLSGKPQDTPGGKAAKLSASHPRPAASSSSSSGTPRGHAHVPLQVPVHLRGGSPSFAADYHDAPPGPSPATEPAPQRSASTSGTTTASGPAPRASSATAATASDSSTHPSNPHPGPHQPPALEGALTHTLSRTSGRRRLHKLVRLPPAPDVHPAAAAAQQQQHQHQHQHHQQQLQRELSVAAQLPQHPHLLLPHRVYTELVEAGASAVHVVYDGAGEELLSYLRARSGRLPEAACCAILRQLLQALRAMHAHRWLHRNISTESVWVHEEPPAQEEPVDTPGWVRVPDASAPQAAGSAGPAAAAESSELDPPPPPPPPLPPGAATAASRPGSAAGSPPGGAAAAGTLGDAAGGGTPPPAGNEGGAPTAGRAPSAAPHRDAHSRRRPPPQLHATLGGLMHAVRQPGDGGVDGGSGGGAGGAEELEDGAALHAVVGCAYHLPPEVIRGAAYSSRADVWAAGAWGGG